MPQLSVVIPAADEEAFLADAIASVRFQRGVDVEVVVVVNGSGDRTLEIARALADRVVHREARLGYSAARNLGARVAKAPVLAFLDADSRMGPAAAERIVRFGAERTFGTVMGRPDPARLRYRTFFLLKNTWHRLGLYHGVLGGLMFCQAGLFRELGGFDVRKEVDELYDFSLRARGAGGRYALIQDRHATTSMRRFERNGMWTTFLFWIHLRFPWLVPWAEVREEGYRLS